MPSISATTVSPSGSSDRSKVNRLFSLTAKFEVSCSADDGATAVDGQTLIGACVSSRLRAADHKVAGHQCVAQVQTQRDLCAIHKPSVRQRVKLSQLIAYSPISKNHKSSSEGFTICTAYDTNCPLTLVLGKENAPTKKTFTGENKRNIK